MTVDAQMNVTEVATVSLHTKVEILIATDRSQEALELVRAMPGDYPWNIEQEKLLAHLASPEAYREHYAGTMRGGACPEEQVFTRHKHVARFASLRQQLLASGAKTVLDLGCLDGWQLLNLAAEGISGVGVDLNAEALSIAAKRTAQYGFDLQWCQMDIETADLQDGSHGEGMFDAVILSEVLEHVLDPIAAFRTAAKHLKRGGKVYVSVPATAIPHHGNLVDASEHLRVFSQADLLAAASSAGLTVMESEVLVEQEDQGQPFTHRNLVLRRARVGVHCNHVTGGWDPREPEELGGSEELVVQLAREWAAAGHEATVWNNGTTNGAVDGVRYLSRDCVPPKESLDLLVCFKTLEWVEAVPARCRIFWTTDAPASGAQFLPPRIAEKLDAIVCISEFQAAQVREKCPWVDPGKIQVRWLGVDKILLDLTKHTDMPVPKVAGRCVYASSLDRGLRGLLEMWPEIKAEVPGATLHVLYGWDRWVRAEAVVPEPVRATMVAERKALQELLKQDGVEFRGHLPRAEYLQEMAEAEAWLYPCTGGELCCKVALEAQALGVVPVVWPTMALRETVAQEFHVPDGGRDMFRTGVKLSLGNAEMQDHARQWAREHVVSWQELAAWAFALTARTNSESVASEPTVPEPGWKSPEIPEVFEIPKRAGQWRDLDLVFVVPGMPFVGDTDRELSLGGSETAGLQLARELAKRGHRVTVFSTHPAGKSPGKYDGVAYLPIEQLGHYLGTVSCDALIAQREPTLVNMPIRSGINVMWMHDLGLSRFQGPVRCSAWNVDYYAPVSHWHGRQLCEVYGLDPAIVAPMRNGIELADITRVTSKTRGSRDPKALVYASRPERGLPLLLDKVFPRLLERDPKLTLYVAGYDNTTEAMQQLYGYCQERVRQYGPRARWMGALKKADLHALESRARAYLYPSEGFEEVNCITAAECAATGLPFIATTLGALPETCGLVPGFAELVQHSGVLTEDLVRAFVDAAWKVISDDATWGRMSEAGQAGAKAYSWEVVATGWEDFLIGAIEQRSANAGRRLLHHWRIGDTFGAKALVEAEGAPEPGSAPGLGKVLAAFTGELPPDTAEPAPGNVIDAMAQCDVPNPCAVAGLGSEGVHLAAEVAAVIAQRGIAVSVTENLAEANLLCGHEVLHGETDPAAYLNALHPAKGGTIVMTVGGPGLGAHRLRGGKPRTMRWEFDHHDLRDLFGDRKGVQHFVLGGNAISAVDDTPLSWQLFRWRPSDGGASKPIDLDRRAALTVPQQTVSVCMIARNEEAMLHRCLKSVRHVADEILLADDGSTDSTREIAEHYGATVFTGESPLKIGFDEARNATVARASGDWVLWIDSDEALLELPKLPKYLRWNMFAGYGMRQHHFSAIPENAFKPDLPVRLFRRAWLDGKPTGIRFFGVVHEHPEVAINCSVGQSVVLSDVHIAHDGYLTESIRRGRFDRNLVLMFRDRQKYPERMLGRFLMIRDWCHLARYSAQNGAGGDVGAYLEAAIEAYQKHFLGRTHTFALDGLQYYNEALQALGRGFDVKVSLMLAGPNGPQQFDYAGRVASKDDLLQMVGKSTEELSAAWGGKYL